MKQNFSIGFQLITLVLSVLFCIVLSSVFSGVTLQLLGFETIDLANPKTYIISGFYSQLIGFIGGFLMFLKITKQSFISVIEINRPNIKLSLVIIGLLLLAYPIMLILGYYNAFLKELIPNNTFILQELETDNYQRNLLENNGTIMLYLKLFVIALLPAIGEELVFRGILLSKIKLASNSEHYGVIVSAVLFATIHLQPTKLLPMIFLGLVLGYIYTKTKNITYSMLFHFLFNGSTIIIAHFDITLESIFF